MEKLQNLSLLDEDWRFIQGTEQKYAVSNMGRVASFNRYPSNKAYIMKQYPYPNGYLRVVIYYPDREKSEMPHRLVAAAFIPNPENKSEVNHINGIKTDNCADNLEWVTRGENCRHAVANGLHRGFEKGHQVANRHRGERSPTAVLTEEQVKSIRADRAAGMKRREIAEKYKIKISTVNSALTCWKHIS